MLLSLQEARDADGVVNVDSLAWLGSQSLLVSASLHPVEDLTAEMVRSNSHSSLCTTLWVVAIRLIGPSFLFACACDAI